MRLADMATDSAIAAVANKAAATGGGVTSLLGGLTANDIAMFGGLALTAISVCVQVYYKRRADRRAAELAALRKRAISAGLQSAGDMDGEDSDDG
ncbi:hypothetical protein STPYR_12784 [uncultured Stenotrophomonas sp.]|uniref:Holin n=1 Tax=uncultured Stenotrophomonas sp. TaxID=165438 RepID=A0A1Y5Q6I3_9GAMM|nr:hypothetical protein STPYR_12784 [uncultured Stenotrophomonas sp.]